VPGEPDWEVSAFLGGSFSFPAKLTVRQLGFPAFDVVHAEYRNRSLDLPIYYAARVARWRADRAWAVELVHHKIYLKDPQPPIQDFNVSHGYNLLTVSRLWNLNGWVVGGGAGAVIAHPENTIRGRRLDSNGGVGGYYLAGPTGAAIAGYRWTMGRDWLMSWEGRLTASYARVPIDGGHASVPDMSAHALFGVGCRLPW
jgi:hypothetical protein